MISIRLSLLVLGSIALDGSYISVIYGSGTGPIVLRRVDCNGDETRLRDCKDSSGPPCSQARSAGVRCRYKGKVLKMTNATKMSLLGKFYYYYYDIL